MLNYNHIQAYTYEQLPVYRQSVTGYGKKMLTGYKLKINNRWYRVYCTNYSNCGTLFIRYHKQDVVLCEYTLKETFTRLDGGI